MNKREREVQQVYLDNENAVLKELELAYKDALKQINRKLEALMARQDADMAHVIYQIEYQKNLKTQVQSILEELQTREFETLSEFLSGSYEDGFIGTMYDLHGQGIEMILPIDQEQMIEAIQHETKLSESLYETLGVDVKDLQKKISGEISRGIASGMIYSDIARNISAMSNIPLNRAMTIARTESHRIQNKASYNASKTAKSKGADIVKIWDSALDKKTRTTHRQLDGQIRELDDPFEIGGKKAMYPGEFGDPAEDVNCRCAYITRNRSRLGAEYTKWSEDAANLDFDAPLVTIKANGYEDFKKKYKQEAKNE